jgi:Ni,Fe-hydrogenase III small subunit
LLRPGRRLPPPAACPTGALTERLDGGRRHVALDLARCVFCGRCAEDPWTDAVAMGRDFELAARGRDDLRIEVVADDPAAPEGPARDPAAAAAAASAEIRRVLGRSLHLRHLDAGSCNACDWELAALLNPVYDVRRLGIDFVASPRHADGVVVTGPVTRNLETAVRRTVEAVPAPRVVIAVGACAASGGIVGEGYASAGGVDRVLPVDVYIPGCPPRPEAIIFGILVAIGRLDARRLPRRGDGATLTTRW